MQIKRGCSAPGIRPRPATSMGAGRDFPLKWIEVDRCRTFIPFRRRGVSLAGGTSHSPPPDRTGRRSTAASASGQDIERDPINYSAATPRNAVTRLQDRIAKGTAKLDFEPEHGYLRSLLRELDVPESSQVLVFSKTSLQRERISPKTPRAIYFNDDVMVGFCLRGRVIEISAADEVVGTAFYTLDQVPEEKPVPQRQTESCLLCHSSSANQGFPGHLVRSLFVDRQGNPLLSSGSFRTDHASPLAERWGGWYVTGTSGRQKHMGNMICEGTQDGPKRWTTPTA